MASDPYQNFVPLFGDMHNHCGISYGHGSLEDALSNAREQLDFVSITGHAHWPDMPEANERIQYIIDFHEEGFARLKSVWNDMMKTLRERNEEGEFVIFPGFEVHFCATGDRNMLYKDLDGEILYPSDLADLHAKLQSLREAGKDSIAQPHHVGYRIGTRGIDWDSFDPAFAPFVEMLSMHGCSESSENTRPFLHSMGPSDWETTIAAGLEKGHIFGFSGGTDHHSGHPGSYGHGRTGLWAENGTREAIWQALYARRMYALTGDRIDLKFSVNGAAMGSVIPVDKQREIKIDISAGGAIDCVDVIKNGKLLRRFSQTDVPESATQPETVRTKIHLELGWGAKHRSAEWNVEFGVEDGKLLHAEPRFRGLEVVSPSERDAEDGESFYGSKVNQINEQCVTFETVSNGNATNSTSATQGMCIEVEMPVSAKVYAIMNGVRAEHTLADLMKGARSGSADHTDAPSWRFNRAPSPEELNWSFSFTDEDTEEAGFYYVRVRQTNDQWAWSSPVFLRNDK
ncbi:MAG: DUF3604 domain-containing protein [Verrucomicrobiales bacterium]|nr:DUF3604 domain-containing protein [Verrucomicrobiales bacterium]